MWAVRRMSLGALGGSPKPKRPKKKKSKAGGRKRSGSKGRRRSSGKGKKGQKLRGHGGSWGPAVPPRGRKGRRPSMEDAYAAAMQPYSKATAPNADIWDGLMAYATREQLKVSLKSDTMQLGASSTARTLQHTFCYADDERKRQHCHGCCGLMTGLLT